MSVQATPVTAFPSHNLHVFVVRDGSALAPDAPGYVRLPYEMSCLEHICAEVSTALYIKESVLSDRALTLRALEEAAGYATLSRFAEGRPTE